MIQFFIGLIKIDNKKDKWIENSLSLLDYFKKKSPSRKTSALI